MTACRDCGAPIAWARVRKLDGSTGKSCALDVAEDGSLLVIEDGHLLLTEAMAYGLPVVRWVGHGGQVRAHASSCPGRAVTPHE